MESESDQGQDSEHSTLDVLLSTTYSRSQLYLSRQLAQLHPELTMPMFSEICHRLQTARPSRNKCLLYYLLPWLYNMELVDANVQESNNQNQTDMSKGREGWGSAEATEMITNNLFYIAVKFGDENPKEVEELWRAVCACWPKNLKIIIRYLFIITGMAPNELVDYAKRVLLYLGRSQPVKTLEEIMSELQTVETLNCVIERTETPPYYRLTSLRKVSPNSDSNIHLTSSKQDLSSTEKGTIHTKRHSQEDPHKVEEKSISLSLSGSIKNAAGNMASSAGSAMVAGIQRVGEKVRALSGSTGLAKQDVTNVLNIPTSDDHITSIRQSGADRHTCSVASTIMTPHLQGLQEDKVMTEPLRPGNTGTDSYPQHHHMKQNHHQPRPLPMPEYGGWFAPLTEFLPDATQPISNFHRCNLAVILLTDLVVDGLDLDCHSVDWSVHIPLMLHIIFLGLDNSRELIYKHCHQLLLNLLIVLGQHSDHLTVSSILMTGQIDQMRFGLSLPPLPIISHDFTEKNDAFDSCSNFMEEEDLNNEMETSGGTISEDDETPGAQSSNSSAVTAKPAITRTDADSGIYHQHLGPDTDQSDLAKALIHFIASKKLQPMWQYEDITRTVWDIHSAEQIDNFLHYILQVFEQSLAHSHLAERWSQLSLQLALSCSSRHYAGRSLQIFRALRVPISSRQLSDILSRLVETIAEQGEDMQGYVTELILTLEAVVETLDSDIRPMDRKGSDIFKSTPNLKDASSTSPKVKNDHDIKEEDASTSAGVDNIPSNAPTPVIAVSPVGHSYHSSAPSGSGKYEKVHSRMKSNSPDAMRGRSSTDSHPHKSSMVANYAATLSRSRSAQSLKVMDAATQDDKMNILVQLFWICLAVLESDYEHEFLLALRLLDKVLAKLPLERPDVRDKVEKLQSQIKWNNFPGAHNLLLKGCTNPNTYEITVQTLSKFTLLLDFQVVDPSQSLAFPMNVIALLPYMVQNYEDANEVCIESAEKHCLREQ